MVRRDVTRCLQIIVSQGTSQGAPQAGGKVLAPFHICVNFQTGLNIYISTIFELELVLLCQSHKRVES